MIAGTRFDLLMVVLCLKALLIEPFLDRVSFVVGLENQVVPVRTADRDVDMATVIFLFDRASQARENGHELFGLLGVIDMHAISARHPVMHGDSALRRGFIMAVQRFEPVGLQPRFPLVGEFVAVERHLRPFDGTELDIDMARVLVSLGLAAELFQRLELLLGIVGAVEVQALPFLESECDCLWTALRLGGGRASKPTPATSCDVVLCDGG